MCSWIWRRNLLCWEWGSEVFIIRKPFIFPKNFLCWEFEVSMCSWHETLRAWRVILWHECFLLFMEGKNCYHQWGFSKTSFKKNLLSIHLDMDVFARLSIKGEPQCENLCNFSDQPSLFHYIGTQENTSLEVWLWVVLSTSVKGNITYNMIEMLFFKDHNKSFTIVHYCWSIHCNL